MAKYVVTSPDGRRFQITAPDGASQSDVMAYAQKQFAQTKPAPQDREAQFQQQNAKNVQDMNTVTLGVPGVDALQFTFHAPPAVARTVAGIGEGASNFYSGLKQHLYDPIADKIDGGNRAEQAQQQVADNRRLSQALNSTTSGKIGNFIGGVASSSPLFLIPGGGETAAARIGLGALAGGAGGYLMPSASTGEEISNTLGGTALGGLLPAAFPAARGAIAPVRNFIQKFTNPGAVADRVVTRRLAGSLGILNPSDASANAALAGLRAGSSGPIGKTAAEVLKTEQAVQAEKAARNSQHGGPEMAAVDNARNAQRLDMLGQHAGNEEVGMNLGRNGEAPTPMDALDAAVQTRRANAQNFRSENMDYLPPSQRWGAGIDTLNNLKMPSRASDADAVDAIKRVFQKVKSGTMQEDDADAAISELRDPIRSQRAQTAIDDALSATRSRQVDPQPLLDTIAKLRMGDGAGTIAPTLKGLQKEIADLQDTRGLVPASSLDAIRRDLGAKLDTYQPLPIPRGQDSRVLSLNPVKDAITDILEKAVPKYGQYLQDYAEQSVPVNTGRTIRNLLDTVGTRGRNATQDPILLKSDLQRTLNAVDKSPYGVSPDAQQTLNDVQESLLSRSGTNQALGSAGTQTATNLQNRLTQPALRSGTGALTGGVVGSFLGPLGSGVGALAGIGAEALSHVGDAAVQRAIAQRLASSSASADSIANVLAGRQNLARFYAGHTLPNASRLGLLLQDYFQRVPSVSSQGAVAPEQPPWMMYGNPQTLPMQ